MISTTITQTSHTDDEKQRSIHRANKSSDENIFEWPNAQKDHVTIRSEKGLKQKRKNAEHKFFLSHFLNTNRPRCKSDLNNHTVCLRFWSKYKLYITKKIKKSPNPISGLAFALEISLAYPNTGMCCRCAAANRWSVHKKKPIQSDMLRWKLTQTIHHSSHIILYSVAPMLKAVKWIRTIIVTLSGSKGWDCSAKHVFMCACKKAKGREWTMDDGQWLFSSSTNILIETMHKVSHGGQAQLQRPPQAFKKTFYKRFIPRKIWINPIYDFPQSKTRSCTIQIF